MAGLVSTKDLSKALNAFLQSPSLPLPDDLTQIIEGYLAKHEKYDDAAAERLHDELVAMWHKHVQSHPEKFAAFLAIQRPLHGAFGSPARLVQWWDMVAGPMIDALGNQKGLWKEALATSFHAITSPPAAGGDGAAINGGNNVLAIRIYHTWMEFLQTRQSIGSTEDVIKMKMVREIMLLYAKKMPKEFLTLADSYLVQKEYRATTLSMLCQLLSSQPPHLYLVMQTPLFGNIVRCLQLDTSTTVVGLALNALIMFLPNMPSSLVPLLPSLFNIYARLLFWDKERSAVSESLLVDAQGQGAAGGNVTWERCLYSPDLDEPTVPHLSNYFTILYGLYPINFVDYIRKPQRYLRHANATEDIEVQPTEVQDRSERFRRCHLLHPNFYSLTIESEKTDFGRWIKAEPAEVVADCMALCLPSDPVFGHRSSLASQADGAQQPPEGEEQDKENTVDASLLSGSVQDPTGTRSSGLTAQRESVSTTAESSAGSVERRLSGLARKDSQSSHPSSSGPAPEPRPVNITEDSPTLPPSLGGPSSQTQLQDMIQSNKLIKSGLHQSLTNDSVPSLALSNQDSLGERTSVLMPLTLVPEAHDLRARNSVGASIPLQVAQLSRQILLLQNDLNFERYMKEQHLAHIGELRSKQMRESVTEAETQDLVMANRHMKKRLEDAKKAELQAKKEADHRRTMATKWESELSGKLRVLRDEQKKWSAEGASLRRELDAAKDKYERLRRLVAETEDKELKSKQHEQLVDPSVDELETLKTEVKRLSDMEREYQAKERAMEAALRAAAEAGSRAEKLALELRTIESELHQTKSQYKAQLAQLQTKLDDAVNDTASKRDTEKMNTMVQRALEASRAKQAELQKQYSMLTRKYMVQQSQLLGTACSPPSNNARVSDDLGGSEELDGDVGASSHSFGSPSSVVRGRLHRGFSDPEMLETSFNVTPPLDAISTSLGGVLQQRPSTPSGSTGTAPDLNPRGSPQQGERYYGRGGVQNAARKDKKDKKPEVDKKDRKAGGIRGIRGFV